MCQRCWKRAAGERLPLTFVEGDAEDIPFPDASFDVVLPTFGVMFSTNQAQAAAELVWCVEEVNVSPLRTGYQRASSGRYSAR